MTTDLSAPGRLKPCPFCGSSLVELRKTTKPPTRAIWWHVICSACGSNSGASLDPVATSVTWQSRPTPTEPVSGLLELARRLAEDDCYAHGFGRCSNIPPNMGGPIGDKLCDPCFARTLLARADALASEPTATKKGQPNE